MSTMKPRSGVVTDGLERAPARGMLRAVGMGDEDWVKPQIGIASSWNEITPCNLSLDRLAISKVLLLFFILSILFHFILCVCLFKYNN